MCVGSSVSKGIDLYCTNFKLYGTMKIHTLAVFLLLWGL